MTGIAIAGRRIAADAPTYIIAELSGNHGQRLNDAIALVHAAADAGADAVKLQTYTADTITLKCANEHFRIAGGTLWDGRTLHDLYGEAHTPWDWHPRLFAEATARGLTCFSTPFDATAVEFLAGLGVPAWKIASFEIVDLPLIRRVAATGLPVIMSTGMATLAEIDEAVAAARGAGCRELCLLKCTSAYPAPAADMHLATIPHLASAFAVVAGLSDHTLGTAVPVAAVALGARVIEKHLCLSRSIPGPDSAFSLEPAEFRQMVEAVRTVEQAIGGVRYAPGSKEAASRIFRRSLFVSADVKAGDAVTPANVRSVRPGNGLPCRHYEEILGRRFTRDATLGTPLAWDMLS
jgi:N-acetylneuraminate synthase